MTYIIVDYNHGELEFHKAPADAYNSLCAERHGAPLSFWDWAMRGGLPGLHNASMTHLPKHNTPFRGYSYPVADRTDVHKWMATLEVEADCPYYVLVATKKRILWLATVEVASKPRYPGTIKEPINELEFLKERIALMRSLVGEHRIYASSQDHVATATYRPSIPLPHGRTPGWIFEISQIPGLPWG